MFSTSSYPVDPRRQSNFFPASDHMGHFYGTLEPGLDDGFYANEMLHAGLQQSPSFHDFDAQLGRLAGCGFESRPSEPLVLPNVRFSSNLLDTPYNGSFTTPTSTTVTPRSLVAPKELPDVNLRNRDFIRDHFSRDQVNREYTFRDPSPLGSRNSFSLSSRGSSLLGGRSSFSSVSNVDVNRLNQLMHSLQLDQPMQRLMDSFTETEKPLSRSSIWSTNSQGSLSQPNQYQNTSYQAPSYQNNFYGSHSKNDMNSNITISPPAAPLSMDPARLRYTLGLFDQPEYDRRKDNKNIYAAKLHNAPYVPIESRDPRETEKRPASRKPLDGDVKNDTKRKKPAISNVVVNFGTLEAQSLPEISSRLAPHAPLAKECSRYVLESCSLKDYPEDFCSTFYKRNTHGYMFIRELSNSLKVNASGPKSWVTLKIKLGELEQQKLKVDVKRLPVWKPINLNQPHTLRKAVRRRKPLKKTTSRRR